jgi:hypothetical protein
MYLHLSRMQSSKLSPIQAWSTSKLCRLQQMCGFISRFTHAKIIVLILPKDSILKISFPHIQKLIYSQVRSTCWLYFWKRPRFETSRDNCMASLMYSMQIHSWSSKEVSCMQYPPTGHCIPLHHLIVKPSPFCISSRASWLQIVDHQMRRMWQNLKVRKKLKPASLNKLNSYNIRYVLEVASLLKGMASIDEKVVKN